MRELLECVAKLENRQEAVVYTVIEGKDFSRKVLMIDGHIVWPKTEEGFLKEHESDLAEMSKTGIYVLDGRQIFADRLGSETKLVICGAGHVALALIPMAKRLGFQVTVAEDREEFAQAAEDAGADPVYCMPFEEALGRISGGENTYFVVLTREHLYDQKCLEAILPKEWAYVGMMGSRGRAALVRRQLLENGLDSQRIDALCAPIGLAIGAQTAAEIALSILAQIVQVKNARPQTEGYPIALLDAMVQAEKARTPAVLATIVARHGSTPRDVGAKMLILPDGNTVGSVGGGIMEHYTVQAALKLLAQAAPALQCLQLSAYGKNEDAAIAACGGSMEVLLQTLCPGEETK